VEKISLAFLFCFLSAIPTATLSQSWTVSRSIDAVEGTPVTTATVTSRSGAAFVRCKSGKLETFFAPLFAYVGQDDARVRYRFSGDTVKDETWDVSTSGTAVFAFYPVDFARDLADATSIALDIYDFGGSPNRVLIPLNGSRVAINRVLSACDLPVKNPAFEYDDIEYEAALELEELTVLEARELLVTFEIESRVARPLELYRFLSNAWRALGTEGCLDSKFKAYPLEYCLKWRRTREVDENAVFPFSPLETISAFLEATKEQETVKPSNLNKP
jgi:hypothetical protein